MTYETSPNSRLTPDSTGLRAAVTRALVFLRDAQLPHGEFRSLIGHEATLSDAEFDSSPFVTALILRALHGLDADTATFSVSRAIGFLLEQREPGGLWRYWSSRSWKHARVPPDLDDTASASLALRLHGREAPGNRRTMLAMRDTEGRFRTWVIPGRDAPVRLRATRWFGDLRAKRRAPAAPASMAANPRFATPQDEIVTGDVDPVVNVNVLAYLGDSDETRQALDYVVGVVTRGLPERFSLYYEDPLTLYYFIASALETVPSLAATSGVIRDTARERVWDGTAEEPMLMALAANVLLTFAPESPETEFAVAALMSSQRPDGSWPRYSFYGGPSEFWGSDELTTALAVESLARFSGAIVRR